MTISCTLTLARRVSSWPFRCSWRRVDMTAWLRPKSPSSTSMRSAHRQGMGVVRGVGPLPAMGTRRRVRPAPHRDGLVERHNVTTLAVARRFSMPARRPHSRVTRSSWRSYYEPVEFVVRIGTSSSCPASFLSSSSRCSLNARRVATSFSASSNATTRRTTDRPQEASTRRSRHSEPNNSSNKPRERVRTESHRPDAECSPDARRPRTDRGPHAPRAQPKESLQPTLARFAARVSKLSGRVDRASVERILDTAAKAITDLEVSNGQ